MGLPNAYSEEPWEGATSDRKSALVRVVIKKNHSDISGERWMERELLRESLNESRV